MAEEEKVAVPEAPASETTPETEPNAEETTTPESSTETPESKAEAEAAVEKETHGDRRMKRLLMEKFEAQAELNAYKAQMAKQQQSAAQAEADAKPTRDQFADDISYFEALSDYKTERVRQELKHELQQTQRASETNTFQASVDEARKTLEDYDDVIAESTIQFNAAVKEAIVTSPYSAYVAYELAKDEDTALRISKLSPMAAAREIGKIEARLEAKKKAPETKIPAKPASKAPAPVKPVVPKGSDSKPGPRSDEEWLAQRRKEKYHLKRG